MRLLIFPALAAIALAASDEVQAQLPPGYWSYYDNNHKPQRRQSAHHETQGNRLPVYATGERSESAAPAADPLDYNGRGMTGRGLSSYQSNGYSGPNQNLYYGYWDGGFQAGSLYGYSMYPHFDRPGFTYWQY